MVCWIVFVGCFMSKILVTGFEAFSGVERNPSEDVARRLGGVGVDSFVLPVTRDAGRIVGELVVGGYDIVLHFGINIHIDRLELERVAINLYDSSKPDNDGYVALEDAVVEGGPAAYFSTLGVKEVARVLKRECVPCAVSNSAGTYICNLVLYHSLHAASLRGLDSRIGFVHVPPLSRDISEEVLVGWCGRLLEVVRGI